MSSRYDDARSAIREHDAARVGALIEASPAILLERDDEGHALLDHALWDLLVGDWSRPPTLAPDPDGARLGVVEVLLDLGADVNGPSQDGWTPLHTALYENHVPLTEMLLARGANPAAEVYGSGGTPLLQALFWGHAAAADALSAHDITPRNLRVAAGLGRADLIVACFDGAALRPEASTRRGYYRPHSGFPEWEPSDDVQEVLDEALCYAVRNGRGDVLDVLVARGADVSRDVYGGAPLHWAASRGDAELCEWLLARGADVNRRAMFGSQRGVTPLHCAAWMDRLASAELLLRFGANPALEDDTHGGTPLGWAQYMESPRVTELLAPRTSSDGSA